MSCIYFLKISGSKGQGHNVVITEMDYGAQLHSLYTYILYYHGTVYTQTPHELYICSNDFGVKKVKGHGHNALITENGFGVSLLSLFTYNHLTSHTVSP